MEMPQNLMIYPAVSPSEWHASWITPPEVREGPCYFRARRKFTRHELGLGALIHIAADSVYLLYVNGHYVGRGPIRATHRTQYFDTYDIAALLNNDGDNWLGVAVFCPNQHTFRYAAECPALLIQAHTGSLATDNHWQIQIADEYRTDVPFYTFQTGPMEWKDNSRSPAGWQVGEDHTVWTHPILASRDDTLATKSLLSRDVPPLESRVDHPTAITSIALTPAIDNATDTAVAARLTNEPHHSFPSHPDFAILLEESISSVDLPLPADRQGISLIFDFGREINGAIELELSGAAGTVVDFGYDETLAPGNRLCVSMHGIYAFADRVILGSGRQIVGNEFSDRGFRFIQIVLRNLSAPVTLHRVSAISRLYPHIQRGVFHAVDDPTAGALFDTCADTIRACTTDVIVDCPWRENSLWFNDLIVQAITTLQAFGDARPIARCLRLAATQIRPDGLLPSVVPTGELPTFTPQQSADWLVLPASNLFIPLILEDYLLYTGDSKLVKQWVVIIQNVLSRIAIWKDERGIIVPPAKHWNFIDWSYNQQMLQGKGSATLNWLYVLCLQSFCRLCNLLETDDIAANFEQEAEWMANATHKHFWDPIRGCYREEAEPSTDDPVITQLSHATALLTGLIPMSCQESVEESLLNDTLLSPDLYLHHFILRAMVATGHEDKAMQRIRRLWYPLIAAGEPTIWEMAVHNPGKQAHGGVGSLCHAFSTTPIDFFHRTAIGIRPTAPGFTRCMFDPRFVGLDETWGSIPTPHGELYVHCRWQNGELSADLIVPAGIVIDTPSVSSLAVGPCVYRSSVANPLIHT